MKQPYLLTLSAVREESQKVWQGILTDQSHYWSYHESALSLLVEKLTKEIRFNYPDLKVPYHSRWRHFEVAGSSNLKDLLASLTDDSKETARVLFEIAIVSVLLDAGAGDKWTYKEPKAAKILNRSEGLAFASLEFYQKGCLSSDGRFVVDPEGIKALSFDTFSQVFQLSDANPLMGDRQRFGLLKNLEAVLLKYPEIFLRSGKNRLGHFFDFILEQSLNGRIGADLLVEKLLLTFGSIWPGRLKLGEESLGDCWKYKDHLLIPFHKLTQWLAYSLWEPLEAYGLIIERKELMTALAEYRNGGLLIDEGVLRPKRQEFLSQCPAADHPLVVEWRAATIILIDLLAERVRQQLHQSLESFPLAKILQGGTWSLGRKVAYEKRSHGGSPLPLLADGTVF